MTRDDLKRLCKLDIDFESIGLMEPGEIWISVLTAIIKVVMIYSYTALVAIAATSVKKGRLLYVLSAMVIHIVSDENIMAALCDTFNLGSGTGVMILVAEACIMLVVTDKMSHLWKERTE